MSDNSVADRYFPAQLPAGLTAKIVDKATVFAINQQTQIFKPNEFGTYQVPAERRDRANAVADRFTHANALPIAFYDAENNPAGWFWGFMEDLETFTIDTFGVLQPFRGYGVYRAFVTLLLEYLKADGFERVSVYTHPNNRAMLIANLKLGFSIAALELNAGLGVLVKLVYQLHADRRRDFSKAFRLLPDDYPEVSVRE